MKIVQKGKYKSYEVTCHQCNSDLEYTENDIFYTQEEKVGGIIKTVSHLFKQDEHYKSIYLYNYKCVKCPVCGYIIKMPDFSKEMKIVGWKEINK